MVVLEAGLEPAHPYGREIFLPLLLSQPPERSWSGLSLHRAKKNGLGDGR